VSIAALFKREDGTAADLEHKQGGADEEAEKEKEAKKVPENGATAAENGATAAASKKKVKIQMAPPLVPARYLPRCLEPHRGVWWREKETAEGDESEGGVAADKNNRTSHGFDARHHWEFFDYGLCPESDIFPCQEGRLESPAEGKDGAETE